MQMLSSFRTKLFALALAVGAVSFSSLAQAAPDAPVPPATSPAAAEGELKATITAVQGIVQVRNDENAEWQTAQVGAIVGQGAEFRTGPR